MIYFLVIHSRRGAHPKVPDMDHLDEYIPSAENFTRGFWSSSDNCLLIYYWVLNGTSFDLDHYLHKDEAKLILFNGWVNDGHPLDAPIKIRNSDFYKSQPSGEYVYLNISIDGNGIFRRNLTGSVQTYFAHQNDTFVLSNRVSLVNCVINNDLSLLSTLDTKFMGWLLSTSWAQDESTLFKDIKILEQGVDINFAPSGVQMEKQPGFDIWADELLQELYQKSPEKYWDLCFEYLTSNLDLFFSYFDKPFDLPLSGGKDSRLLLGLILQSKGSSLLNKLVTNGPPYSGEVVTGKLIADHLNIKHESNDRSYMGFDMTDKFGDHIYFTEGEVSPMDLSPNHGRVLKKMVLRGQEVGLRNISDVASSSRTDIEQWFERHFGGFNRIGILDQDFVNQLKKSFSEKWYTPSITDISNLPTKNRIETRYLRWGARIWGVHNTNEFTPFIFLDDNIVKHTYNIGAEARKDEEFHYEMLKRCGNDLVSMPFFNQKWPEKYNMPDRMIKHYQVDKKPMRGSHAVLNKNLVEIKQFIKHSNLAKLMEPIINWEQFDNFQPEMLKSGHYQPFWHLVQLAVISNVDSFKQSDFENVAEKMKELPVLKDDAAVPSARAQETARSDKYRDVIVELLVERERYAPTLPTNESIIAKLKKGAKRMLSK